MSLGSPLPVEVLVAGPDREQVRVHALKILAQMKNISTLRDVQLYQQLDYPAVRVDIDRQRAGLSGVTVQGVANSLLVGTSSSRYVTKNYWRDPHSGVDYQVQVQVAGPRMDRPPAGRDLAAGKGQPRFEPSGPRRGEGEFGHRARRNRPPVDAALLERRSPTSRGKTWAGPRSALPRPSPTPGSRPAASACWSAGRSRPWRRCSSRWPWAWPWPWA